MKATFINFFAFLASAIMANARMVNLVFEDLSPKDQLAWGITVDRTKSIDRTKSSLEIVIPARRAQACHGARLFLHDKKGVEIADIRMGLEKRDDGSLSISIVLSDEFGGDSSLSIFIDAPPDARSCPNFGGFTFELFPSSVKPKAPNKPVDATARSPVVKPESPAPTHHL